MNEENFARIAQLVEALEVAEANGDEEGAELARQLLLQLNEEQHLAEDPLAPDSAHVEARANRRMLVKRVQAFAAARRAVRVAPTPKQARTRNRARAPRAQQTRSVVSGADPPTDEPDPSSLALLLAPLLPKFAALIAPHVAALVALATDVAPPAFLEERRAAEHFGIEPRSLRAARKAGELSTRKVGRVVVLDVAEVEAWLRGHHVERAPVDVSPPVVEPVSDGGKPRTPLRALRGGKAVRS
jgi:hypothetical protein